MVEGARNDILPVGPVPGNRNGNDLVKDSLEEETVWMPSTEVTDQAPKGPIAQVPGPPDEIPPAPVAPKCLGNLPLQLFGGLPDKQGHQ